MIYPDFQGKRQYPGYSGAFLDACVTRHPAQDKRNGFVFLQTVFCWGERHGIKISMAGVYVQVSPALP